MTVDRKEKSLISLSSVIENVQRLNEDIKNQSSDLKHSASFALLEQARKNRQLDHY